MKCIEKYMDANDYRLGLSSSKNEYIFVFENWLTDFKGEGGTY